MRGAKAEARSFGGLDIDGRARVSGNWNSQGLKRNYPNRKRDKQRKNYCSRYEDFRHLMDDVEGDTADFLSVLI